MEFTVNTDLSAYSDEEIADLLAQGNGFLDELFALDKPSAEQFAQAKQINEDVQRLQAEADSRAAAAAEQESEWATLRDSRVTASNDDSDEEEEEDEEEESEEEVADEVEAAAKPATRAPAKVTARAALAGKRPATKPKPARPPMAITAAADVPGFATSSQIDGISQLADALINRVSGFPRTPEGRQGAMWQPYGLAQFRKTFSDDLVAHGDRNDMNALAAAVDESRLPGQSLVAAGGWCAPSETLYDFCENATAEGLVSLPEIQANRGGVNFTTGPSFSTLYTSGGGFTQTEAEAISGTAKGCYEVACPTFTEVRLDAIGMCIKVPILTNAAYPELVQSTIRQSLLAHQHRVSAYALTKMLAASTAVTVNAAGATTATALNTIDYLAAGLRQDYRLPFNATIEVAAPFYLRNVIRADLANRGGVDLLAVSDADIDRYFAARNLAVQYLYNWPSMTLDTTQEGWPASTQIMVYPAGTFVKATTDVINLSAVYDAASLNVNTYTGLFMEEGVAVFKRCFASKKATLLLCQDGSTGAADLATCFTLT